MFGFLELSANRTEFLGFTTGIPKELQNRWQLGAIIRYYLIHKIGLSRATLVISVFPLGGVLLGKIFQHEQFSWLLSMGTALITSAVAVVNWKKK